MKYINKYNTKAQYDADANRPTTDRTVSSIVESGEVKFDGKNVLVDKPGAGIGDILVYNTKTASLQFIKLDTYNAATIPAGITPIGVVYYRTENRVNIVAKNNAGSAKWAAEYIVKLSGFDAAGGSFTVTVNSTSTASIAYAAGASLATIATSVASALDVAGFKSSGGWSVAANVAANCVVITRNYYTPAITGISVTDAANKVLATTITPKDYQCTLSGLATPYGSITRKDGGSSYFAGANFPKFYDYYYNNGATDTNQALQASSPVRYSVFNAVSNPILTAYYGTGEAAYAAYIQDKMVKYPYSKNAIIDDDGFKNTSKLATESFINVDGTTKPAYPAAFNAKNYGVSIPGYTTGLEPGAWWLPANREMYLLIKDVLLNSLDPVNRSLTAIGGDRVLASGVIYWCSSEYSSLGAWTYYGSTGHLNLYSKNTTLTCRPVTAF